MKEKVQRKLKLSKEIVRELQTKELEEAYGGGHVAPTCTASGSCPATWVCTDGCG